MTKYNTLNVKLSNLQLNKFKSRITLLTFVTLSTEVNFDSNDETIFPHKFLLTNTQLSRLRNVFVNNSSGNIKLSKTQLSRLIQSGGCLDIL